MSDQQPVQGIQVQQPVQSGGSRRKVRVLVLLAVLAGGGLAAAKFTGWWPFARPATASASTSAKDQAYVAALQSVRAHLAAYRRDHRSKSPDFRRDNNPWQQFMSKTDESGVVGPAGKFGPYFKDRPVNPQNGFHQVEVTDGPPYPGRKFANVGWVFESKSGQIWGTNARQEVDPR